MQARICDCKFISVGNVYMYFKQVPYDLQLFTIKETFYTMLIRAGIYTVRNWTIYRSERHGASSGSRPVMSRSQIRVGAVQSGSGVRSEWEPSSQVQESDQSGSRPVRARSQIRDQDELWVLGQLHVGVRFDEVRKRCLLCCF